jgi:hypothetical protein
VSGAAATAQTTADKVVIGHKGKTETQTASTSRADFVAPSIPVTEAKGLGTTKSSFAIK